MEHRRRREQGAQPAQETLVQQTAMEETMDMAETAPEVQLQPAEQLDQPRRRRRAQAAQEALTQETAVQETAVQQPAAKKSAAAGSAVRMPKLPHEDVRVEEETERPVSKKKAAKALGEETPREKRTYTSRIPHKDLKEAQRKAAKKAKKLGRAVREGGKPLLAVLGSALMSIGMLIGEGVSKLGSCAARFGKGISARISEEGHAPAAEAIELEAIRPEDYHGRAQHRNDIQSAQTEKRGFAPGRVTRKRGGRGRMHFDMQQLLSLVFAGVAIVSACMIVSILWRTVRTNATNKKVAELYAQSEQNMPNPAASPELIVFMPEESGDEQEEPDSVGAEDAVSEMDGEALPGSEQGEDDTPADDLWADIGSEPTPAPAPDSAAAAGPTIAPMGKRIYHHVGGDALPQMAALHKENRDIVGWLKIENVLDLPVVYRDNSYYLKRDFYKQKNTAGTIFLDENHPFKAKTQNLLLHGHNMKDGTMFGRLIQYETDLNYVRWHPFVRFDTLWRKEEYVIFAVLRVSLDLRSEDFFNYFSYPTFLSDEQFMSYIRQLQLRSLYAIPVDVKPTDALLTMSTCLEEDRLVIVARRVREGETHTELRQVTNLTTRQ